MQVRNMATFARKYYIIMQIEEMLPLEKYEIYIKPDFDSASWRFSHGKHQIVIGEHLFKNMTKEVPEKEKVLYMRAYLYHELAHSIWTDKDLNSINMKLKKLGFSFSMFNLFEDARIEEKMRHHLQKHFSWSHFEDIIDAKNPIELFFLFIQAENKTRVIHDIELNLNKKLIQHFDLVYKFYKRTLLCKSHVEIIELLKEWYDVFPQTPVYEEENKLKSYTYIMESQYIDDEKFDELIEGLTDTLLNKKEKKATTLRNKRVTSNNSLLSDTPLKIPFDIQPKNLLIQKIKELFKAPRRSSATRIPSKRLSIKNIVTGSDKIFRRKDKDEFTKKSVSIVLDLSSSMYPIIESMRLIMDVLDTMVAQNLIDATLLLSGVSAGKSLYEVLEMPLEDRLIQRIIPLFEAEGLHHTMSSNIKLIQKSDYVWVFTDGMICEGNINKEYYHKHGIKTHAFYIGEIDYKSTLELSFDTVVCEKDAIGLAEKIFTLVK